MMCWPEALVICTYRTLGAAPPATFLNGPFFPSPCEVLLRAMKIIDVEPSYGYRLIADVNCTAVSLARRLHIVRSRRLPKAAVSSRSCTQVSHQISRLYLVILIGDDRPNVLLRLRCERFQFTNRRHTVVVIIQPRLGPCKL